MEYNLINFFWFNKLFIHNKTWAKLPKSSKTVFPVITSFCNKYGRAFPGEKTISKFSGRTEKTVRYGINKLDGTCEFQKIFVKNKKGNMYKVTFPEELFPKFQFFKSIISSGTWAKLTPTAQSLYPVLRYFGFLNKELLENIENLIFTTRHFDICKNNYNAFSEYTGISKRSVKKALDDLVEHGLIEKLNSNGFKGWIVYYHPIHVLKENFKNICEISYFERSRNLIIETFDSYPEKIYKPETLESLFEINKKAWNLDSSSSFSIFSDFILKNEIFEKITIKLYWTEFIRYIYKNPSVLKIVSTLRHPSYLTHYSAMFIHGLTEQISYNIYINHEQNDKEEHKHILTQDNINKAFQKNQRITNSISYYADHRIFFLNGKYTNHSGVVNIIYENEKISVTNLERTLIDIAIRPAYSGGIYEVFKAYELASEEVSINKLTSILKKLNYIYPYHQVIGFYLEKTGKYRESQINLLKEIPIKYKFYLTHGMKEMDFSEKWQLYYPKGF